jgi:NifU-like protein involved in Fe-S cluster formation
MSQKDTDVGTGLVGAPACGDVMKLQIRVDPNSNTIADVKFKTFGCGSAIASSSYLTELVRGMSLDQAVKIRNTDIAKELCLPPVKREFWTADGFEVTKLTVCSALLDVSGGCYQVCHQQLLY